MPTRRDRRPAEPAGQPAAKSTGRRCRADNPQAPQGVRLLRGRERSTARCSSRCEPRVGKPAYFNGGRAEEIFTQQLDQVLSQEAAASPAPKQRSPDRCTNCSPLGRRHDRERQTDASLLGNRTGHAVERPVGRPGRTVATSSPESGNCWPPRTSKGWRRSAPQEQQLMRRLAGLPRRREQLLARAAQEGLPAKSIQAVAERLPAAAAAALRHGSIWPGAAAGCCSKQSLVNWVVVQRTLLHLSQLLEIIATGGRLQPTYGERGRAAASGA